VNVPIVTLFFFRPHVPLPLEIIPPLIVVVQIALRGIVDMKLLVVVDGGGGTPSRKTIENIFKL
jgi:hypothetical protein